MIGRVVPDAPLVEAAAICLAALLFAAAAALLLGGRRTGPKTPGPPVDSPTQELPAVRYGDQERPAAPPPRAAPPGPPAQVSVRSRRSRRPRSGSRSSASCKRVAWPLPCR
ncbi:hypothetical protein ACFQ1L_33720 [Phytohabitans flavus]|uniref:hypothetical protein n=1 Tax=Phytohabitans flavus TaxID=1076124 RepID=UPI00363A47CD